LQFVNQKSSLVVVGAMISSVVKQSLIQNTKQIAKRGIASVVNKNDITVSDFGVKNEPILGYMPGSPERAALEESLKKYRDHTEDVPIIIGGKEYRTDDVRYQVMPHNHSKKVAKFYYATPELVQKAITTSLEAKKEWERVPLEDRMQMYLRVADQMAGEYRADLNATTMLGQAKTVVQAEIDAAAELIDFLRFNCYFGKELLKYQPISEKPDTTLNLMRYRSLEGFIASVSPFNFTAIAGNLAYTPAVMGNGVVWKPSDTAILSNHLIYKIFKEAGFPDGVVNFVPSDGPVFGKAVTSHPELAAINFTGSVPTFQWLWKAVGQNLHNYTGFPKLIGECGGKNYHFVHPSAHVDAVVAGTIRSAFEFQGQKCSACSRVYVPESLWPQVKEGLVEKHKTLKVGDVENFENFMSAVIDKKSFDRVSGYIEHAKQSPNTSIVAGGTYDESVGYFVQPTIVETTTPKDRIFSEEIFGPLVTAYVYKDSDLMSTLEGVATDTPYALTGAIFSQDEEFAIKATELLKGTAGNFYVNDKSTGSVVGQQPFGGARLSGTNDKAGGPSYMLKFASAQSIKQTFVPLTDIEYPYMK